MRYISTRGGAPACDFDTALLCAPAPDGGLYVPEAWPGLSSSAIETLRGRFYCELAHALIAPYVGRCIDAAELAAMIEDS